MLENIRLTGIAWRRLGPCMAAVLLWWAQTASAQEPRIHHDLKAVLSPAEQRLTVVDTVTFPEHTPPELSFYLRSGMRPVSPSSLVRIEKQPSDGAPESLDKFRIVLPPGLTSFTVSYEGRIYEPVTRRGKAQPRGMDETSGIIAPDGVFLSAASGWYPDFGGGFVTFSLETTLPAGWDAVSQGERTKHDRGSNATVVRWKSPEPQEGIFLIAAPFIEYAKHAGPVQTLAELRSPDPALAAKYLDATANYLALYSSLIGPYPYRKFALVENFWETGYGMPSFTLLGPRIIRLPFIINTSYPHEILHNWWGNSVYPDVGQGNWSEGLTAYLADHLMREQQGGGAEYRAATLQKYADYVRGNKDFPLTEFRSRSDSSSEAIGYGKSLMFFHMLRNELGDETFVRGLRAFYRKYRFHYADFDAIRTSFEAVSGKDLTRMFGQWVTKTGAPQLAASKPTVTSVAGGFVLSMVLEQTQRGDAYQLRVPLAITLEDRDKAVQTDVVMNDKRLDVRIPLPAVPQRVDVDPEYDLFRRLDRDETPPALSQLLGSAKLTVVLPSGSSRDLLAGYREFAASLGQAGPDAVEVKLDSELKVLPRGNAVLLLGWENRFLVDLLQSMLDYNVSVRGGAVRINETSIPLDNHSFVLTSRSAGREALGLVASGRPAALRGLARKLPHYQKYSYLAFEGNEPENVAKGRWPVVDSPLTLYLPAKNGVIRKVEQAKLAYREPLATLAQVFSRQRMMDTVRYLSSEELGGRGFGSPGLARAAEYIAKEFKDAGLVPGGERENSWFETWEEIGGPESRSAELMNVIGVIPGAKPEYREQYIVIGAHYDHLGTGWPESRDKTAGRIHPGADDNASGVAVMLELARGLAKGPKPDRTIVFAAFTAEDAGRRGSKFFTINGKRFPLRNCTAMIDLDSVGRLGRNKLLALGTGSAKEWPHIVRAAGLAAGVDVDAAGIELDSSDQKSFHEAGVPAVQLFTGPHADYHRSTDTADKIDDEGLLKVANVAREIVLQLLDRRAPLTSSLTATTMPQQREKPLRAPAPPAAEGKAP